MVPRNCSPAHHHLLGQICNVISVQIYGEKDPDGFYMGEVNGRQGLVPGNMVSEVQVDDPDVAAQLLSESGRSGSVRPAPITDRDHRDSVDQRQPNGMAQGHARKAICIYLNQLPYPPTHQLHRVGRLIEAMYFFQRILKKKIIGI